MCQVETAHGAETARNTCDKMKIPRKGDIGALLVTIEKVSSLILLFHGVSVWFSGVIITQEFDYILFYLHNLLATLQIILYR